MEMPLRRSSVALCALALAALLQPSSSFILAIDLGSQFFKAAIVKPGTPFEIVHNTHSKRKTPTAVSFHDAVRTFGDDAIPNAGKNMKKTPMLFTAQLGRNVTADGSSLHWLPETFYPFKLEQGAWGGLQFRGSEDVAYSVEDATAHVLTFAKQIAEEAADGAKVSETILTVPSDATFNRRRAILAAAEIAGLPRPHLMHETSASALQRSLDLDLSVKKPEASQDTNATAANGTDEDGAAPANDTSEDGAAANASEADIGAPSAEEPAAEEEPEAEGEVPRQRVLFYNMGARHVEACVVEYRDAKFLGKPTVSMDMLGCGVSEELGGHQVDMAIAKRMLEAFQAKQPKLADGVVKSVRALRKLEKEANGAKHVLSANKEGQFRVESLFEDTDFFAQVTREELELWCKDLFASITAPIEDALAASNTSIAELDAVEMVGGGWRIPRVQSLLAEYIAGKRPEGAPLVLSQHVNGEEGMATGAAFYVANNSVSFRTKKIYFTDTMPHSYSLLLEPANLSQPHPEGWSNSTELFGANSVLGSKKTVKVHQAFDVRASLYENGRVVQVWELQGVHAAATEKYSHLDPPLMTLKFELDTSGVLQLSGGTAIFDELIVDPPKVVANVSAKAAAEGYAKEGEAQEGDAKEEDAKEGEAKEEKPKEDEAKEGEPKADEAKEGEAKEGEAKEGEAKEGEAKDEPEKEKKPKFRKLKVALKVTDRNDDLSQRVMSAEEKAEARTRLRAMEEADAEVHRTKVAQNSLEAFIYEAREKMSDDENCVKVSTEEEREAITSQCASLEDWLYEDEATSANASVFEGKHAGLKGLVHPILRRAHELTQRPEIEEAVDKVREGLNRTLTYVEQNMTWVSQKEREGVTNLSVAFEEWYANVTELQKARADTEEPAFYVADAQRRLQKLQSEGIRLTKIKKIDYDYSKYGEDKYGGGYGGYGGRGGAGGYGYDDPKMRAYYEEMFKNFNATNGSSNYSDFWKNRNFSNFSSNDSDYMKSFYDHAARNASAADKDGEKAGTEKDGVKGGAEEKGEKGGAEKEPGQAEAEAEAEHSEL